MTEYSRMTGLKAVDTRQERLTGQIIGCAIEVHKMLGPGFLEGIYHAALCRELRSADLAVRSEVEVTVEYKGTVVGRHRLDLVVAGQVVVELKTVRTLDPVHAAQVRSYLRATRLRIGLLLNFNGPVLSAKRILNGWAPPIP